MALPASMLPRSFLDEWDGLEREAIAMSLCVCASMGGGGRNSDQTRWLIRTLPWSEAESGARVTVIIRSHRVLGNDFSAGRDPEQ